MDIHPIQSDIIQLAGRQSSLCPWCDLLEELLCREDLGTADVFQRRSGVAVEGGKGSHIKVDEEEMAYTATVSA